MKVLHVITALGVGGAEQQLRLLVRHLPVDSDVAALAALGPVADALRADGVRVAHIGMRHNRDLSALGRLTRLIRSGGYDLVHTHLYRACLYGRIAARLAGVRAIVATEHSLCETTLEGRELNAGIRGLYTATERLGRATVAVSPTVAQLLRGWGVPAGRIHTVPNGIDIDRFAYDEIRRKEARSYYALPEDAFVVGAVGRLVPTKRFEVLIQALAQLPAPVRLLVVGGGEQEAVLRGLARALGVEERVVFAGTRSYADDPAADPAPGVPSLLAAMDVLAAPATAETFGLAVLEGLAAGLPVLYTTAPALTDLPPGSVPTARRIEGGAQEYALELRRLYAAGPGDRTTPEAVAHYGIEHCAERLMDVYAAASVPDRTQTGSE
ncbi:glycosyltransferase [Streptomyces polyrhachis]|uniref:D-inositol 3-phosphate glycosyltransferase n=1 Tax=Streptomyces polyrhachis TaxID=1282885 RepID=A0ABW2GJP8_9ACTN